MFDTFFGLPLHVLILHATVMTIPLGAVITAAVMLRPRWREHYIGLLAGFNIALLALTFVTVQAGQALQTQLGGQIAQDHEAYGRILLWIMVGLAVASVVAWVVQRQDVPPVARQGFAGVVAVVALAAGVQTVVVGHSGSDSKWGGTFDRKRPAAASQSTVTQEPAEAPAPAPGAAAPAQTAAAQTPAVPAAAKPLQIVIKDFKFLPENATIKKGQQVTVVNMDTVEHTLTADDGSFDTGLLGKGESKTITVKKAGKNGYFCEPHQYMTGTITVS